MLLEVIRTLNLNSLIIRGLNKPSCLKNNVINPISAVSLGHQHKRGIAGRHLRDDSIKKPAPWPYKEKAYKWYHSFFDSTLDRFDENSRLIVIDGNIGSGKTSLAKTLAEELDMYYIPECNMSNTHITDTGFDLRAIDHLIPKRCRTLDIKQFYTEDDVSLRSRFQQRMFLLRFEQYIDALAHLFSTGQGVILERSVYSDFVFVNSLLKMGYIPNGFNEYYQDLLYNTMVFLMHPHLCIYLDVPVDTLMERIKKRNLPYEVNSKILNKKYLEALDYEYKREYLRDISKYSELLIFDWSKYGDPQAVIEDIERVDFEKYDKYDLKLRDWRQADSSWWDLTRQEYTRRKSHLLAIAQTVPYFYIPELWIPIEDMAEAVDVLQEVPEMKYSKGYRPEDNVLFKFKTNYWEYQKLTFY